MNSYTNQVLRVTTAQICKRIGWQSITTTSLEILIDILERYITEICQTTHNYAEHCNRSEANINDLELAFKDMGINMAEVMEYISYVDPIVPVIDAPKIPVSKESHFNFLKPGSKEVLTRPVHIHEHLPPLNPPEDEPMYGQNDKDLIDVVGIGGDEVFKKRPEGTNGETSAKKIKLEEEGRATREISSVMMTTSGFISPAREGKLPESRPPILPEEFPKTVPSPMISPSSFKSKDSVPTQIGDKKLEKKLKKKGHDKERKKEKHLKDKFPLPDPSSLDQYNPPSALPPVISREADEQLLMAERKKELKKLKMKNKEEKKKKEKTSKAIFTAPKFDPFEVLPPPLAPVVSASQSCQAHNFLTGAAHNIFGTTNNVLDQNLFGSPPLASQSNPLIDGKLVSEPDKNKLNIFKKIQRSAKEEPIQQAVKVSPQASDFFTPSKFDQHNFESLQQKMPKLPKDTTLTRIDEPINLSGQPFEQPQLPKTPTMPRTPDLKLQQSLERKEKKERKKREKQLLQQQQHQQQQLDWAAQQQSYTNAFENNPFLQSLQSAGLMNPFLNATRNPFDIFPSAPGLIPSFGMNQSLLNPYGNSQGINLLPTTSTKKVKQSIPQNDIFQMGSKFCNVPSMLPPTPSNNPKDRSFVEQPQKFLNEPQHILPLQQPINSTFDQLLKDQQANQQSNIVTPAKRLLEKEMETFDLTKDSSPEPTMAMPSIPNAQLAVPEPQIVQQTLIPPQPLQQQQQQPPQVLPTTPEISEMPIVKEKSKEKKKKKDKDKEERKKKKKEKKKKKDKHKEKHRTSMSTLDSQSNDTEDTADNGSTSSMPKLTLKLNSPRPNTPDSKKLLLHRARNDDFEFSSPHQDTPLMRDPSPELVRISPLVTRPPKQKSSTSIYPTGDFISPPPQSYYAPQVRQQYYQECQEQYQQVYEGSTLESYSSYQQPPTYHHQQSNQTWNISQNKSSYIDADGSTVWICPACGSIDDGSPMIGCDSCDAWYHWACVGIVVEPKDDEDWFCRACISRKTQGDDGEGKKKKRKKKDREKREVH